MREDGGGKNVVQLFGSGDREAKGAFAGRTVTLVLVEETGRGLNSECTRTRHRRRRINQADAAVASREPPQRRGNGHVALREQTVREMPGGWRHQKHRRNSSAQHQVREGFEGGDASIGWRRHAPHGGATIAEARRDEDDVGSPRQQAAEKRGKPRRDCVLSSQRKVLWKGCVREEHAQPADDAIGPEAEAVLTEAIVGPRKPSPRQATTVPRAGAAGWAMLDACDAADVLDLRLKPGPAD